jgi:hypothetical protein
MQEAEGGKWWCIAWPSKLARAEAAEFGIVPYVLCIDQSGCLWIAQTSRYTGEGRPEPTARTLVEAKVERRPTGTVLVDCFGDQWASAVDLGWW